MAAVHGAEEETWRHGDRRLLPDTSGATSREATAEGLSISSNHGTIARVKVTRNNENGEEEEKAIPTSELICPRLNHVDDEKPWFPNNVTDPRLCVSFKLSDAHGDTVPYTINRYLRDYQREGIRFMYNSYRHSRGCILGDDMGLGKTVQVIALLAALLQKTGTWEDVRNNRPQFLQSQASLKPSKPKKVFLIVAPLSVLYNWRDELETWGHFQCVIVHGLRKEEQLDRIRKGRTEIALTTHETLRLCLEDFNSIDWSAVVVDEAHKLKNPLAQITQAMKGLRCEVRIGLTGTILQNNLEELWCVMDWAIPGCLGSLGNFRNRFSDPIEQGLRHSATKRALATGRKTVRTLVRQISRWFLRRNKALIKEQLPKKDDRVVFCSMTDFQQIVYQTVLDSEDVNLLLRSSEKCECQSGRTRRGCCWTTNPEGVKVKDLYFIYLAILRKAANNVALLQSTAGTSKNQEKYVAAICAKVFQKFPDFVQRCKEEAFEALSDPKYSGKMKVLQKLLRYYLRKKDKVLLFSLSTKLLDVLESYCMAEGLDYSRLDGSTKAKERVKIVKEFNSSAHTNICLVSTMAGGLGLNFVGANVVVLFDPTWNPANDLQAIDRAYRIGQCRDVTVLRLISLGTVEEIIYLRQVYKQQLQCTVVGKESARRYFEAVQGDDDQKGELFGVKNLFRMQVNGTCLTRKILEREGRVEAGVVTSLVHQSEEKTEETEGAADLTKDALDEGAVKVGDGLQVCGGVLDFSSGSESEEDGRAAKKNPPAAGDSGSGGNMASGPGRISLLQHGFSKLLESVKRNAEGGDGGSSSDVGENSTCDESEDEQKEPVATSACTKTDKNSVSSKTWQLLSGSDSEGTGSIEAESKMKASPPRRSHDAVRKMPHRRQNSAPSRRRLENYSDESDDLDVATTSKSGGVEESHCKVRDMRGKRSGCGRTGPRGGAAHKPRYSEDIEMFTSSEDEHTPVKRSRPAGCQVTSPQNTVTGLKPPSSPIIRGNIDSVLGGVREVMYTHSNQRVVGGSKVEELIGRAAVRDVFQRRGYSQLPANDILDGVESLCASPPDSPDPPTVVRPDKPSAEHPVTFTSKSVHRTKHTTFIIGETPRAVCREQLEEMAKKFDFPSARHFAANILVMTSSQRVTRLREYYTSLNQPGLSCTVAGNFPKLQPAQTPSSDATAVTGTHARTTETDPQALSAADVLSSHGSCVRKEQKRQKIFRQNIQQPERREETVSGDILSTSAVLDTAGGRSLGSAKDATAVLDCVKKDGLSATKPTGSVSEREPVPISHTGGNAQGHEGVPSHVQQATPSPSRQSFLAELIGDTSILDDLLKPKSRSPTAARSDGGKHLAKPSPAEESVASPKPNKVPAKARCKDFWDILNEGNEESINRLTDPAEVQKACVNTKFAAGGASAEGERKSLWKTNENFLWKK